MAEQSQGGPKLHVDDDWKAELQAEKARLEEKVKAAESAKPAAGGGSAGAGGAKPGGIPKASFDTLVNHMASQALMLLGAVPDPRTGQRMAHPDLARFHIDTLAVIEEKTKGNLNETEARLLSTTLYELRQIYIQMLTAAREQRKG